MASKFRVRPLTRRHHVAGYFNSGQHMPAGVQHRVALPASMRCRDALAGYKKKMKGPDTVMANGRGSVLMMVGDVSRDRVRGRTDQRDLQDESTRMAGGYIPLRQTHCEHGQSRYARDTKELPMSRRRRVKEQRAVGASQRFNGHPTKSCGRLTCASMMAPVRQATI